MSPLLSDVPAAYRDQLARVLGSETFQNKESLRSLLAYLAEKALAGEGEALKEYTVGVQHLHKPEDYNPQLDASVRVQAGKLRQKLQDYYWTEGAADPVIIEFPKGHFQLRFRDRGDEDFGASNLAPAPLVRKWKRISFALGGALATLVAFTVYWLASLPRQEQNPAWAQAAFTPHLEAIWQPYLESSRPVLICLGTPLFTKFAGAFVRIPKLNEWEEAWPSPQLEAFQRMLESSYAQPSHNFTGAGEAMGAFLLVKLLLPRRHDLSVRRSNVLTWEDIRDNNVIFLGSPKFNPQLKSLPIEQDFVIEGGGIQNRRPQPGEQASYDEVWAPEKSSILEDYALITRLPGLHGRGEITVLAASSTEGTWAAVEYVTQLEYAKDLVARIQGPSDGLPKSYQVIINAKFKTQVPVQLSYVTHRVLTTEGQSTEGEKDVANKASAGKLGE